MQHRHAATEAPAAATRVDRHTSKARRQADAEGIAERVRRIGRDDERAATGLRRGDGSRRRARRFADAAFAAVEEEVSQKLETGT